MSGSSIFWRCGPKDSAIGKSLTSPGGNFPRSQKRFIAQSHKYERHFMNSAGHPGEDVLVLYVDNEMSMDERSMIESHVRNCGSCRRDLDEIESTSAHIEEYLHAQLA